MFELFIIAFALAMDAFAVAMTRGCSMKNRVNYIEISAICLSFALFQGIMPVIGYYSANWISNKVIDYGVIISAIIIMLIGIKMEYDAIRRKDKEIKRFSFKILIILSVATSIDALVAGVSFAFIYDTIWLISLIIAVTTLTLSFVGAFIGYIFGNKFEKMAEIAGGIILLAVALKIILSHYNLISFKFSL